MQARKTAKAVRAEQRRQRRARQKAKHGEEHFDWDVAQTSAPAPAPKEPNPLLGPNMRVSPAMAAAAVK